MPTSDAIESRFHAATRFAREAGDFTLKRFHSKAYGAETKRDGTVVTLADREAEQLLRDRIKEAFPGDGVLGEEFGETKGDSGFRWVLDPIDGTASFVHGVPLYGTLVAVETLEGGPRSVVGVIHMPALGETVAAAEGFGCLHAPGGGKIGRKAEVSRTTSLRDATMVTTAVDYFAKDGRESLYLDLTRQFKYTRGWSDCYAHVLVATGRADVCIEPSVNPWDVAPMTVIMREAGGRYTSWDGVETAHTKDGVASNGHLHEDVLKLLKSR